MDWLIVADVPGSLLKWSHGEQGCLSLQRSASGNVWKRVGYFWLLYEPHNNNRSADSAANCKHCSLKLTLASRLLQRETPVFGVVAPHWPPFCLRLLPHESYHMWAQLRQQTAAQSCVQCLFNIYSYWTYQSRHHTVFSPRRQTC